jgi:hypothetical protein
LVSSFSLRSACSFFKMSSFTLISRVSAFWTKTIQWVGLWEYLFRSSVMSNYEWKVLWEFVLL